MDVDQMSVTTGRMRDGVEGVRDVDNPCPEFRIGAPSGTCQSDGHYICQECRLLCRSKTPAGRLVELDEYLEISHDVDHADIIRWFSTWR